MPPNKEKWLHKARLRYMEMPQHTVSPPRKARLARLPPEQAGELPQTGSGRLPPPK
jgi:hypothetical protein